MNDPAQTLTLEARRRLEHSFRQLEVLVLQERLAALMGREKTDADASLQIPGEPRSL